MDLGTISNKLATGQYGAITEFEYDVELVFLNCLLYNQNPVTSVHQGGKKRNLFLLLRTMKLSNVV
jgi:hypothetical protein